MAWALDINNNSELGISTSLSPISGFVVVQDISGASAASATVAGDIDVQVGLIGSSAGVGAVTASLLIHPSIPLGAAVSGQSGVSAQLASTVALGGVSAASAIMAGLLQRVLGLVGNAAAVTTATGTIDVITIAENVISAWLASSGAPVYVGLVPAHGHNSRQPAVVIHVDGGSVNNAGVVLSLAVVVRCYDVTVTGARLLEEQVRGVLDNQSFRQVKLARLKQPGALAQLDGGLPYTESVYNVWWKLL